MICLNENFDAEKLSASTQQGWLTWTGAFYCAPCYILLGGIKNAVKAPPHFVSQIVGQYRSILDSPTTLVPRYGDNQATLFRLSTTSSTLNQI